MDYFLKQDLRAKSLAKDSVTLTDKLELKNIDIANLKANEDDLKMYMQNDKIITGNIKKELDSVRIKYNKSQTKLNRRTGFLIGSMTVNLLFITIVAIKVL